MTTQVKKEIYVLTEEEKNQRKAMAFLKGCIVGFTIENGGKYESTKEPSEDFQKGLDNAKPQKRMNGSWEYTRKVSKEWVTVCHILHNRMRHNRPHTKSIESDQETLDLYGNRLAVKEFTEILEIYGIETSILRGSK